MQATGREAIGDGHGTEDATAMTPERFFDGSPLGRSVFERVRRVLDRFEPVEVRTSKSQVAFRANRSFAILWRPGQYLARPDAEVVLSIALDRHDDSPRFKEVAHPARTHWLHHLEVGRPDEIDDEVAGWLREAAETAGARRGTPVSPRRSAGR